MTAYQQAWSEFYNEYRTYRRSQKNWIAYLDEVDGLVSEAYALVDADHFLDAHEEALEPIRIVMRDFRGSNGFPKFITDRMTDFHALMGAIIAIVQSDIGDAQIDQLYDLYDDASRAWSKVEKNPVDQQLWGLGAGEIVSYAVSVEAERAALDAFEEALATGVPAEIKRAGVALKPPQALAYILFGNFPEFGGAAGS